MSDADGTVKGYCNNTFGAQSTKIRQKSPRYEMEYTNLWR